MKKDRPIIEYVLRSHARTQVLLAVAEDCDSTQALLDRDLASKSAVYNALSELQEQGLIYNPRSKRWSPTGTGTVVTDMINRQRKTESVLATDPDYWQTHDVTVLPPKFRTRLTELADGDVIRATETRPANAICEVKQCLTKANSIDAITPVYNERLADAATDANITRIIFDEDVLETLVEDPSAEDINNPELIRVTEVSFAITITDDCLLLSLPTLDGKYDPQTEFIADSNAAQQWGKDLLEHYWTSAQTPEQYLSVPI
ncbi:helix-turn-helix transcriptional regulator [Halomicrococcus sp. NG-SE-24]|uniref:helix-turn-helix transcriptional regulator n=1 Tax=Halomicrococcus sp. NG-SE-24 TaxID=3436928 RepID=UPI003D99E844